MTVQRSRGVRMLAVAGLSQALGVEPSQAGSLIQQLTISAFSSTTAPSVNKSHFRFFVAVINLSLNPEYLEIDLGKGD